MNFDYYTQLNEFLKTIWIIAIPCGILFIVQIFRMGLKFRELLKVENINILQKKRSIFSFENIVLFLTGFSWSGILFYYQFSNLNYLLIAMCIYGILFILAFRYILNAKYKEVNNQKLIEPKEN